MSVATEIERIQGAKADLKTAINSKTDSQHQITTETIDNYADFVDSISTGGGGNLQTKNVTITENGTTTVLPDSGYTGLDEVNITANVSGATVPSEYTLLDYIETRNTGYMNINYFPNDNTSYEAYCQLNYSQKADGSLFGVRTSPGSSDEFILWYNNSSLQTTETISPRRGIISGSAVTSTYPGSGFPWRTIKLDNKVFSIDGTTIYTYTNTLTTSTKSMFLFVMNSNGSDDTRGFYGRLKYLKISENNVLMKHFVPVRRNQDGIVGVYDLVNDDFYSNERNILNFIAGPVADKYE